MSQRLCAAALVPSGFAVERVDRTDVGTDMVVRPTSRSSVCPECGCRASRVHSRYRRCLGDLPLAGRPVRLVLMARRFRCSAIKCKRRIFTERFDNDAVLPWARRTARLDLLVFHLGLALGGRPAARFARRKDLAAVRAAIVLPWSNGQTEGQITKLKLVKRQMYGRAKLICSRQD